MLDRSDVRRPAQVNACFEGGSSQRDEIIAALRATGLRDNQVTVIDRPDPEDSDVALVEPSFLDRIKALFGKGDDGDDEAHKRYDLLILVHLGNDEALAGPVQDVFKRFNAARVNYYPVAEVEMHALGQGGPGTGTRLTTDIDTAGGHTGTTGPGATDVRATSAGGTNITDVRVEPGEIEPYSTVQISNASESEPGVVVEEVAPTQPATGNNAAVRRDPRT